VELQTSLLPICAKIAVQMRRLRCISTLVILSKALHLSSELLCGPCESLKIGILHCGFGYSTQEHKSRSVGLNLDRIYEKHIAPFD
jgi:hypothetical protein